MLYITSLFNFYFSKYTWSGAPIRKSDNPMDPDMDHVLKNPPIIRSGSESDKIRRIRIWIKGDPIQIRSIDTPNPIQTNHISSDSSLNLFNPVSNWIEIILIRFGWVEHGFRVFINRSNSTRLKNMRTYSLLVWFN